jgi:hypothetical protein
VLSTKAARKGLKLDMTLASMQMNSQMYTIALHLMQMLSPIYSHRLKAMLLIQTKSAFAR